MKKLFIGIVIGCLLVPLALFAESITATGMSQRALHKFLSNIVTMDTEIKTDYNALFANYTGLRRQVISFNNYSAARDAIRARSTTATAVATTSLSLSGL